MTAATAKTPTTLEEPTAVLAIDWSGAKKATHQNIWWALVEDGTVTELDQAADRECAYRKILKLKDQDPRLIVGLDFAFSLPEWFVQEHGGSAIELWGRAAEKGEDWLKDWKENKDPYPGKPRFRRTEDDCRRRPGITPKSVFALGVPGQVGYGTIRGLPKLAELHEAKFNIWPFDPPAYPLVIEIYPSCLYPRPGTGRSKRSDRLRIAKDPESWFSTEVLPSVA